MSAIREALRCPMKHLIRRDDCRYCRDVRAALAEVEAMERVVEAARWVAKQDAKANPYRDCRCRICAALAELDGQTEGGNPSGSPLADGQREGTTGMASLPTGPSSVCPCRVHGDPDGDCGGGLIYQPTRREMGVDAPDFGPIMGCCGDPGDCGETCA